MGYAVPYVPLKPKKRDCGVNMIPAAGSDHHDTMSSTVSIHPVALLHVSDYYTRGKIRGQKQFVGAFVGTLSRQQIVIRNAFEVVVNKGQIDLEYFDRKLQLYMTTFPGDVLVGWFYLSADQIGHAPDESCLAFHKQILSQYEASLVGIFDDRLEQTKSVTQLPLRLYDLKVNELKYKPIESVNVKIDTEEAERIAVEDVMREAKTEGAAGRQTESSKSIETDLSNGVQSDCSALEMLRQRLECLDKYVVDVIDGKLPRNHDLLRRINLFMCNIARAAHSEDEDPEYRAALQNQTLNVLVEAIAASVTKGVELNEHLEARVHALGPLSPQEKVIKSIRR